MKRGRGVLLYGKHEPMISGYLVIGGEEYEIIGHRVSEVRTNLSVHQTGVEAQEVQGDLFETDAS